MTILFSPIGTADPLTLLGDGPMLHIVRHYRPEKVVLFLSPQMTLYEESDHRYTRAIQLLADEENWDCPKIACTNSDFKDVYKFDYYIREFEAALSKLDSQETDRPILLNGSSGTPAMEQALAALSAFGRLNVKLLQVTTPRKGANQKGVRENPDKYDFETLWELNPDRKNAGEKRIIEVDSPNFSEQLLRENAIALIENYNYEAALELMSRIHQINPQAFELTQAASDRLNMVSGKHSDIFAQMKLPSRRHDALVEYLLVMEVRLAQGHYGEFVRLITPALTELAKRRLDDVLPQERYLTRRNGVYTDELNYQKIDEDEKLREALGITESFRPKYISNGQLIRLVKTYCKNEYCKERLTQIRNVEESARHDLAHTITSSDRGNIEKKIGMPLDEVLNVLFELYGDAQKGIYNQINNKIKALLFERS